MNPRHTPTPLLAAMAAAFSLSLAACGGGNGEAPPVSTSTPQVAVAPVVTITNDITAEVATGQMVFTFSFNRDVGTSFTAEDVAVTGGTKGAFTRSSGTRATLVVVPAPNTTGMVQLSVAAGAVTDALGAPNAAVSAQKAFNTVAPPAPPPATGTVVLANFDTLRPTVAGFEGAEGSAIEAGPAGGGAGLSFKVLRSGGQVFALGLIETAVPIPVTATRRTVSAQVFSPVAGVPMVMKLEGPNGANTGDVTANEAVVVGWQTLTWTFTTAVPASTYNKIVLLPNLGTVDAPPGRAYFFDNIELRETPAAPPPPPPAGGTVVANFDDISPPAAGFEGAEGSSIETGPAGGGSGRSFRLLRSGGQVFALGLIEATVPITATRRTVSAQVFSPAAGVPMVMKLEGPNNANTGDVAANEAVVAGWQTLTWTFSNANPAATYNKIVLLPNLGTVDAPPGRAYFFDTITLLGQPTGGGGSGGFAGVWANDYRGDLFVNARSAQGGDVGFFFDNRLGATKAYDYAGVAGLAQNPGGVPNFYFGLGLNPPAITDAFFGAFVKAPSNGVVDVSGFARLKVNVWGPDQLFRTGAFPNLRVVLQGPARTGCASPSGGSEVQANFATTTQGAASVYTLTLANFSIAHACNGETTVAQVLREVTQMNILLLNTNIQYTQRDPDGVAFTNGLNVGTLVFE